MGSQLLLTSSIAHAEYVQTITTLQALTGCRRPQTISTYTILTKPRNVFKPKFEPGKVNQIEQYYMKCTTTWEGDGARSLDLKQPILEDTEINVDRLFTGKQVKNWTLQISDIPNAGKHQVSVQNFYESTLVHHHTSVVVAPVVKAEKTPNHDDLVEIRTETAPASHTASMSEKSTQEKEQNRESKKIDDIEMVVEEESGEQKDSFLQFLEDLGYESVSQYWLKGIRMFYGDIVLEIFKVFIRDDEAPHKEDKIRLTALDPSNTFQIKAYVCFPKNASVDSINRGTKELTNLKSELSNLFELTVPDRMCMDSRVPRAM